MTATIAPVDGDLDANAGADADAGGTVAVGPSAPGPLPSLGGDRGSAGDGDRGGTSDAALDDREVAPVTATLVAVSGLLSALGAAWMVGGIFRGPEARLVAVASALLGAGLSHAATRWRAPVLHYLVLPAALLLGAVLMSSSSGAGTSSLPALVKDAATSSQVLQPPIDFAPGWRLIVVSILALLTAAASALALSLGRTRLAVAVPAPLTAAAALVQPPGSAVATSAVSVGFVVMALATSFAADGVGESFDVRFEVRRLGRSAIAGMLLIATLIAASKVSFLFPDTDQHRVIPPRKPPVSPPPKDVALYTVKGELTGPLRVGVIDVYDAEEQAWLLPPVDNRRLLRLELPAALPGAAPLGRAGDTRRRVTVKIEQATGHALPELAGTVRVSGSASVDFDPRTQTLALANRPLYTGLAYTLSVVPPPTGAQLSASDAPVPREVREFLAAPPPPPTVEALLADAPAGTYARMQHLRAELYSHFTAAGEGKPTDVSPARVAQLLEGGTGNPYELTASEALLARWAGVPSRMGYGYYNGQTRPDGSVEFRPANAATYLEVYVAPYGWVPVVGTPPQAQASLSKNQQTTDTRIEAAPDLGLQVLLPVRQPDDIPLYEYVRYYGARALPIAVMLGLALLLYPLALKVVRRRRRERWAVARGPAGVVAVAYCDLRDRMLELALPGRGATPLELVELVEDDEEHAELAWLVTRGLWGDLRGRLTEDDAAAALELAQSVGDRLAKAQPETARLLAAVSRASLRHPYSPEVPNVWWELRFPRPRGRAVLRQLRALGRLRPSAATATAVVVATLVVGGCAGAPEARSAASVPFPARIAPESLAGFAVNSEPKAEKAYTEGARDRDVIVGKGKVVSFSRNGLIEAALQVGQFKPGYTSSDEEVVAAITASLGTSGKVRPLRPEGDHRLFGSTQGSQRLYLWFPTTQAMALLVVRAQITEGGAEALARALIRYGEGEPINEPALAAALASPQPQEGSP